MNEYMKMLKQLEFRKQTEEAKFEAFSLMCKKVVDLEKENAELKERVKTLTIHDTNAVLSGLEMKVLKESHRDRANKTQEQLTKAKELLKKVVGSFYYLCEINNFSTNYECLAEAEQFLKE